MEGNYGIYLGNEQIGKAQVLRQGLYYQFYCRCKLTGAVMCRLVVFCGDRQENLGVLIPMDGSFGLDTRIPAKRFPAGEPQFKVIPKHEKSEGFFAPIYPEEPFAYIDRLKDGFLEIRNGQAGLVLAENGAHLS